MDNLKDGPTPFGMLVDDHDLGDLSFEEVISGGRPQHKFTLNEVRLASDRVRKTGAVALLEQWQREDRVPAGPGGRTRLVSFHAALTALLLLAGRRSPSYLTSAGDVLRNLDDDQRALLDLPDRTWDQKAFRRGSVERWHDNVHSTFDLMRTLTDPYPMERKQAKSYSEIRDVLDRHDVAREEVMRARLNLFTRGFLHMTYLSQPRAIRRLSKKIDISLDQTYVTTPLVKGYSRKRLSERIKEETATPVGERKPGPTDAFAAWYPMKGDHPDLPKGTKDPFSPEDEGKKGLSDFAWGWVANIAVRVDSEHTTGPGRFPHIAMSMNLSMPNVGVAEEAVTLMENAIVDGVQPGIVDADKAYFANAIVERLHNPTHNLGFTPSTDYRVDRLGIQEAAKNSGRGMTAIRKTGRRHPKPPPEKAPDVGGAVLVEGSHYCPATPKPLLNATKDLVNHNIDESTFYARAAERKQFLIRPKEKWDDKDRAPHMCPAAGNSPTVVCPIREMAKNAVNKPRPHVSEDDLPEFLDRICTQHSVSISKSDGLRQRQAFPYKSKEWETFHRHARNSIESLNGMVKDAGGEQIGAAGRRRARGFAAAQILITIQITNYNLTRIAEFLRQQLHSAVRTPEQAAATPARRRRDAQFHNPYTGTYPRDFTHERTAVAQT